MSTAAETTSPRPRPAPRVRETLAAIAPDPLLTASLYADSALDQAVAEIVLPFARQLRERPASAGARLWLLRYGAGGEHLKLRVHAPAGLAGEIGGLLLLQADAAWPRLADAPGGDRGRWRQAPPIDLDEAAGSDRPDRSLFFSSYRRSGVSFGESPLLDDDRWVSLAVACLAAACDRLLEFFAAQPQPISRARKQLPLAELFAEALSASGWPAETRSAYLLYHRDTLFRRLLTGRDDPDSGAARLLDRCGQNVRQIQDPGGALGRFIARSFDGGPPLHPTVWQESCRAATEFASAADSRLLPRFDPFAAERRFVPLFKILHGAANQLGVGNLDEAQVCHLLLSLSGGEANRAILFYPDWNWTDG